LGEISSSEASETIVPGDDRDLATPTIQELEEEDDNVLDLAGITEPYDVPIPEDVIRAGGLEGPSIIYGHPFQAVSSGSQIQQQQQGFLYEEEEEEPETSEASAGTWHSSSVRTAVSGSDVVVKQESGKEEMTGKGSGKESAGISEEKKKESILSPEDGSTISSPIDSSGTRNGASTSRSLPSQSSVR